MKGNIAPLVSTDTLIDELNDNNLFHATIKRRLLTDQDEIKRLTDTIERLEDDRRWRMIFSGAI